MGGGIKERKINCDAFSHFAKSEAPWDMCACTFFAAIFLRSVHSFQCMVSGFLLCIIFQLLCIGTREPIASFVLTLRRQDFHFVSTHPPRARRILHRTMHTHCELSFFYGRQMHFSICLCIHQLGDLRGLVNFITNFQRAKLFFTAIESQETWKELLSVISCLAFHFPTSSH